MSKIFHHTAPLPAYAWPGGYPIAYLSERHPDRCGTCVLCAKCATEEKHEGAQVTPFVRWEGEPEICENCNVEIESAYGVPEGES